MKTFNYVFIGIVGLLLISALVGISFTGGFTSKTISLIIGAIAISLITNSIYHNFFIKKNETDERNINIENKAKAKAFDVMGIIFGILIIIYVMLKYNLLIILLAIITYLIISIVYLIYFSKYHKEM